MELTNKNNFSFLLRAVAINVSILLLLPQHGASVAVPQMGGGGASSSAPPAGPTRPPFPDKAACDKALVPGQPPRDKTAFMTNLVARTQLLGASQYAEIHGLTHVLNQKPTQEVWKPANFTVTSNYAGSQGQMWQFEQDYSQTFSEATSGKAYVLLGQDKKPRANCTFYQTEFPALKNSGKVDEIMWADYSPGMDFSTPIDQNNKTWWKKGDPDPKPDPISIHTTPPICSSTEYPAANHCGANEAVDALSGSPTSQFCVEAGDCKRASCAGDTGVYVCNSQKSQLCIDNENLALSVDELQQGCDPYYDSPVVDCKQEVIPALKQAYDEHFQIVVKGGEQGCAPLAGQPGGSIGSQAPSK